MNSKGNSGLKYFSHGVRWRFTHQRFLTSEKTLVLKSSISNIEVQCSYIPGCAGETGWTARLKKGSDRLSITTICLNWVNEELNRLKDGQMVIAYNQFIRQDLTFVIKNELQNIGSLSDINTGLSVESLTDRISSSLQAKLDFILEITESKIIALVDKYETSNIQLTNAAMKES